MKSVDTPRLRLIPFAPEHLVALVDAPERFAERFGYPIAAGVGEFFTSGELSPAWLSMLRDAAAQGVGRDPWIFGFAVLHRASGQVIGTAAFKGPPDDDGVVEIAYGIAPDFQGRGYATEAAEALVRFACEDEQVRVVRAHTLPVEGPSPAVLRKCGFAYLGEVEDPEDGMVWRWERGVETRR